MAAIKTKTNVFIIHFALIPDKVPGTLNREFCITFISRLNALDYTKLIS